MLVNFSDGWILVETLMLKLGQDYEAELRLRFWSLILAQIMRLKFSRILKLNFDQVLVIWPKSTSFYLVKAPDPSVCYTFAIFFGIGVALGETFFLFHHCPFWRWWCLLLLLALIPCSAVTFLHFSRVS